MITIEKCSSEERADLYWNALIIAIHYYLDINNIWLIINTERHEVLFAIQEALIGRMVFWIHLLWNDERNVAPL